jgi:hypothetical protein
MAAMKMASGSMRCVNDNGHYDDMIYFFFFLFANLAGPSIFS